MIDLHMHSTFSDGTYTPEELVKEGVAIGLKAMALTDHDTTNGVGRFLAAAKEAGVRALTGVEVSADPNQGTMHVLGYCVEPTDPVLVEHLKWIREGRDARNVEILHKLNELGCHITMEQIRSYAGEDVVGRPHFAQALIAAGYAKDKKDAFEKYLARGKAAYVERRRLSPAATLELIRRAKGVPVLAHPFTLNLDPGALRQQVKELVGAGLLGIEVYYSEHTPERIKEYLKLAKEFNLVASGGTDFHGANSPQVRMGYGFGNMSIPDDIADKIEALRGR
jgi:predicted metal-dependent phosphoesterase TrpH